MWVWVFPRVSPFSCSCSMSPSQTVKPSGPTTSFLLPHTRFNPGLVTRLMPISCKRHLGNISLPAEEKHPKADLERRSSSSARRCEEKTRVICSSPDPVRLSFPRLMSVLLLSKPTCVCVYVCVLMLKPFTFDQTKTTAVFIAWRFKANS